MKTLNFEPCIDISTRVAWSCCVCSRPEPGRPGQQVCVEGSDPSAEYDHPHSCPLHHLRIWWVHAAYPQVPQQGVSRWWPHPQQDGGCGRGTGKVRGPGGHVPREPPFSGETPMVHESGLQVSCKLYVSHKLMLWHMEGISFSSLCSLFLLFI